MNFSFPKFVCPLKLSIYFSILLTFLPFISLTFSSILLAFFLSKYSVDLFILLPFCFLFEVTFHFYQQTFENVIWPFSFFDIFECSDWETVTLLGNAVILCSHACIPVLFVCLLVWASLHASCEGLLNMQTIPVSSVPNAIERGEGHLLQKQ